MKLSVCVCCLIISSGCHDISPAVEVPEQMTLYSIDGFVHQRDDIPEGAAGFHGFPILGQVEVTDRQQRSDLIRAFQHGVNESGNQLASCFWPRHALRITDAGKTTDYVICFECLRCERYDGKVEQHDENSDSTEPISRAPQRLFNKVLTSAKVPLAR